MHWEEWIPMSTPQAKPQEDSPDNATEEELDRDEIFHVLQCRRRRLVLKYLQEYDGDEPASMSDIAEHIAAHENDTTVDALRSQERQRVYIALYQSHLPKMDKIGVIEYEQYRGEVKPTEMTQEFERYLFDEPSLIANDEEGEAGDETETEQAESTNGSLSESDEQATKLEEQSVEFEEESDPWSRRYLYTTGGALTALSGAFLGLLPQLWVTLFVTGSFGLLGVGHAFEELGPFPS